MTTTNLDAVTELFDLFGETGYCTICQEDLREGDRIRAVLRCQHMFHSACVDPWLETHGDCPLCRTAVVVPTGRPQQIIGDANQTIRTLYNTIHDTIRTLPIGIASTITVTNIMNQIEELIAQTATTEQPNPQQERDRYILSYCIASGILKKYRSASTFNSNRHAVRQLLNVFMLENLRPYPIECDNYAALERSRLAFQSELCRRLQIQTNVGIKTNPAVRLIKDKLVNMDNELIRSHWLA